MQIETVPLLSDNYAWLLRHPQNSDCAIVDPSEAPPVLDLLQQKGLNLKAILATHHHWDHTGGIEGLVKACGSVEVFCSAHDKAEARVPQATVGLDDGATFELLGTEVRCMSVPGHTLGAIAFYVPSAKAVFTGDTLFTAGCGRLFEGTPEQMHTSLSKLGELPEDTMVYCGHEYTQKNLEFASTITPDDGAVAGRLAEVRALRAIDKPTVPAPLAVEKQTNPFMRATDNTVAEVLGIQGPVEVFTELRQRRNDF